MASSRLSPTHRTFIVTQFAEYESATDIQKALKENFDVEVTLPAVTHYNPEANRSLGAKWKELFETTRKGFIENAATIAIAQKSYRLKELGKHYRRQVTAAKQNPVEIRATLEQAARESGDSFSNRRELTGSGGKPIVPEGSNVVFYLPDNGRGDAGGKPVPDPNAETGDAPN